MRLLVCLAEHAGEVVSIDDLLSQVWSGVSVTPDSVYQAVASLRRLLGDDSKHPTYIATVPRLGYRMVATVGPWAEDSGPSRPVTLAAFGSIAPKGKGRISFGLAAFCVALLIVVGSLFLFRVKLASRVSPVPSSIVSQPQKSIAVLPFLDLTEKMNEEPFADGMTEELIDRLSKIPGLRVPAPRASFYFKGKQIPLAEIASNLRVAYVLDGSVRKSGSRLRVAARLVRADKGYVVWSETYDRPSDDILKVQDDIAGEVTKALQPSIDTGPGSNESR